MSTKFLSSVCVNNEGRFREFIDSLNHDARIAWYPSAGTDFRAMLYLDSAYLQYDPPVQGKDPKEPDIFLFTDYTVMSDIFSNIIVNEKPGIAYKDDRTIVIVDYIEQARPISNDDRIPSFELFEQFTNKMYYLECTIQSNLFGILHKKLLYAFTYNETMATNLLLPFNALCSHVIHVRYGFGFGGANCSGLWIKHLLQVLRTEVYINDGHAFLSDADKSVIRSMQGLVPRFDCTRKKVIRTVPGSRWSDHGNVNWQVINSQDDILNYNNEAEIYLSMRRIQKLRL